MKTMRAQLDVAVRAAEEIKRVATRKQLAQNEKERQLRLAAQMQIKDLLDLQAKARARSAAAVEMLQADVTAARAAETIELQSTTGNVGPADGVDTLAAALAAEQERRKKAEKHFDELLHAHLFISTHDQVEQVWRSPYLATWRPGDLTLSLSPQRDRRGEPFRETPHHQLHWRAQEYEQDQGHEHECATHAVQPMRKTVALLLKDDEEEVVAPSSMHTPTRTVGKTISPVFTPESPSQSTQSSSPRAVLAKTPPRRPAMAADAVADPERKTLETTADADEVTIVGGRRWQGKVGGTHRSHTPVRVAKQPSAILHPHCRNFVVLLLSHSLHPSADETNRLHVRRSSKPEFAARLRGRHSHGDDRARRHVSRLHKRLVRKCLRAWLV